ncbi:hypothetical protein FOG18_11805 [Legionella israelensis]|uniref:hypothetical protein n=1 Tax=Legionella israelensis TaxID=454 RepID=UPI00117CA7F0|nr:hypothetical protein [Legionella israelensis]QDP73194.1 hypothetical protein FOG18_11805 [Legionella israelensis]
MLDNAFGQKRGYLKKNVSESALASHSPSTIQSLANAYNPGGTSKAEDIFFINADKANKDKINKQSHFIHLSSESIQNKSYLFEILLRTTPVFDIYKSIDKSKTSKQVKNEFKKQLLDYQLNHLKQVTDWQKELLDKGDMLKNTSKKQEKPIEDYKEYTEIVTNEPDWGTIQKEKISELERKTAAYRQVLQGIQYLIFDTKWNIGILGGVNIVDETTGQKNTVPKGMNAILQEINKAQTGETTWIEALDKVKQLSIVSATKKNHGFFNKRGETTQQFYDKVQQIIKDEEKKDFKI